MVKRTSKRWIYFNILTLLLSIVLSSYIIYDKFIYKGPKYEEVQIKELEFFSAEAVNFLASCVEYCAKMISNAGNVTDKCIYRRGSWGCVIGNSDCQTDNKVFLTKECEPTKIYRKDYGTYILE